MKNLLLITLTALMLVGCSKDEEEIVTPAPTPTNAPVFTTCSNFTSNLVGVWNLGAHEYDENNGNGFYNTGETGTMTFLSNGSYTHSDFTYAWHCEPGANEADAGSWSYDQVTNKLTLYSTKSQTDIQFGFTHSNPTISPDIISCSPNQVIFQYTGITCTYQTIKITLIR